MIPKFIFPILGILVLTSCVAPTPEQHLPTAVSYVTATWAVTAAAIPSETPLPPPPQPTAAPVQGTASTQINVRAKPSTAGTVLGVLAANTIVQILGKDPGGNWFQILYPQGADGKGWVTAQYVFVASGTEVAVLGAAPGNPDQGKLAIVQQQLNVRSGPGTGFNSLGTLNAQDVVTLTGKDANGAWLQIEFPAGPQGRGWLNAAFVQAQGVESLPIITEAGEIIGTGTPTGIPPTPTPTVIPAWDDQDSQTNPIANVILEPLGTRTLIYSGDVSAPTGDLQDWLQFTPYSTSVFASIDCGNSDNLQISFFEDGQPVSLPLACGQDLKRITVKAGSAYLILLQAPQFSGGVQYFDYTITIRTDP